jgi:hypothetical protein
LKLTPTTPVIQSKETEEDPHESSVPIAQFDQEASDKIPNVPVYNMILDENNTLVVTELPEKLSTTAMKNLNEEKQLNQGSTLVLFLLAALLFCACVMASTLAFVSSFRNERTSEEK